MGFHFLVQGIFLIQRWNWSLLHLVNWPFTPVSPGKPKKHLSPGQLKIAAHPQTGNNITDLPESRGSRESRQILPLCGWLRHLLILYKSGEKDVSWGNNILYFPLHLHSIVLNQQPASSPTFKWTMPLYTTLRLKTYL